MSADEQQGMSTATDWASATETIDRFLQLFVRTSSLELAYELRAGSESDHPRLAAIFTGSDTGLLTSRNAESLHALESLAVSILRLAPEQHDLLSFDAEGYKTRRAEQIRRAAEIGVASVEENGRPYAFPPMNSRERRMLHLELASSGLRTESSGDSSRRFVVLYPAGPSVESSVDGSADRTKMLRERFRPR